MKEIAVIQMGESGHLKLPAWIRKEYGFMGGDLVSIRLDDEDNIVLCRPATVCGLCKARDRLIKVGGKYICEDCMQEITHFIAGQSD